MAATDKATVATLNRDGRTPLHRQLKWLIQRGIDDGQFRVGDRLPSENDFARTYGVSRHLVRQALLSLVAEGRVVARQGYGYSVNARRIRRELPVLTGYTAAMRAVDPSSRVSVLHQELVPAPDEVASRLGGRRGSHVVLIERLAHLGREPVALLTDYFHRRFADVLLHADLEDRPLYEWLERQAGIRGVRAPTVVSVDFVGHRESLLLRIPEGSPLIRLDISTYAEDGFLFSCSSARFRSDRFEFTLEKTAQ
jgi:GntR family transcriptional regulator